MNPATVANDSPHHHTFTMSDIDTFSDSDWLDIASSRESDIDSLSNPDSDHADVSASLSRRSSFSTGSSRDGEVDAWEGFVEDAPEEETSPHVVERHPSPIETQDHRSVNEVQEDIAEERRVLDGLEQSLISTLSASRSSSHDSTTHNSLRDLRLSFPDPLTSSRDELPGLYDTSSSPTTLSEATSTNEPIATPAPGAPPPMQDPGLNITPEVRIQESAKLGVDIKNTTSEVVLYGAPSSIKWSFVRDLLGKAALGSGRHLEVIGDNETDKQYIRLTRKAFEPFSFTRLQQSDTILVKDRTGVLMPSSGRSPSRPSLAILFLPCKPSLELPKHHTLYLPVVIDTSDETGNVHDSSTTMLQAHLAWSSVNVPPERVLTLKRSNSPLFAVKDVKDLNAYRAHRSLRRITERQSWRSMHAMTIFALLSLIIGLAVHNVLRSQTRAAHAPAFTTNTPENETSGASRMNSTALAVRTTSELFIAPASLSTGPPAYERGSTAAESSASTSVITYTKAANALQVITSGSKLKALTEKIKTTKDLTTRPSTTTTCQKETQDDQSTGSTSQVVQEESTSSLSLRLVDSLSEIIEVSIKALVEVVQHDLADLMLAIDELMNAIHRQTRMVAEHSRTTMQTVKEHFEYRNARAKGKAKELRDKGLRLVSSAGDAIIRRTRTARRRAQALRDDVASSEAWAKYDRVQGGWANTLNQRNRRGTNRRCRAGKDGRHATCH